MANIQIQSLHFDASEALKEFAQKKVLKLQKYSDEIISVDVTLKVTKPETNKNKEASIKMIVKNDELYASKVGETFEESIDLCAEALEKQLIKHKEKTVGK